MATVTTPLRIGPADHGRTMTLEEFLDADVEEGYRYELARGVLEVNEVPNDPHGGVVCNLYRAVGRYRRATSGHHPPLRRRQRVPASGSPGSSRAGIPTWASSSAVPPRIGEAGGSRRWPPRSSRAAASSATT